MKSSIMTKSGNPRGNLFFGDRLYTRKLCRRRCAIKVIKCCFLSFFLKLTQWPLFFISVLKSSKSALTYVKIEKINGAVIILQAHNNQPFGAFPILCMLNGVIFFFLEIMYFLKCLDISKMSTVTFLY